MQDRYVGDIGDFANNGLLRWLCGKPELADNHKDSPTDKLKLGVVWYRHPNEPSHGGLISYLSKTTENYKDFRKCDTFLYVTLKELVFRDNRTIKAFQQKKILPCSAEGYYDQELSYIIREPLESKRETRDKWLKNALKVVDENKSNVIFINPDNGISEDESKRYRNSYGPGNPGGPKYVYIDELQLFGGKGRSLVIYHHLGRNEKHTKQIKDWSERLRCKFPRACIWALSHQYKGVARAYFIIAQTEEHKRIIKQRLDSFRRSPWCTKPRQHFTLYKRNGKPLKPLPCSP